MFQYWNKLSKLAGILGHHRPNPSDR